MTMSVIRHTGARQGLATLLTVTLLAGCAVIDTHRGEPLEAGARWVQLPIANYAETPMAGQRAESILATLLHQRILSPLARYSSASRQGGLPDFNVDQTYQEALEWARSEGYRYGMTGSVEEWHYKSGLDGEPAVGISLKVVDIASGNTLWSASGARTGWGYSTVSGTAQKLMSDLISTFPVQE